MIAKVVVGTQFGPVVAYNFDQNRPGHGRAVVLYSTLAAEDPSRFAAEFDRVAARRPAVRRAVFHGSLRLAPGERAAPARLAEIARDFMTELGFVGAQYVVIQHASDHVHLIGNRVLPDGRIIPDGMIRLRANQVVTGLEERYRLRPGTDLARRRRLDAHLEAAVAGAVRRSDGQRKSLTTILAEHGVRPTWAVRQKMVVGVRYSLDELAYSRRGCQLRECSWPHLQRRLRDRQLECRTEEAAREEAAREEIRRAEARRERERVAREEREEWEWRARAAERRALAWAALAEEREQGRLRLERGADGRQGRPDQAPGEGSSQGKGAQGGEWQPERTRGPADDRPAGPAVLAPPVASEPAAERVRGTEPAPTWNTPPAGIPAASGTPPGDPPVRPPMVPTPPRPPVAPPGTRPAAPPSRPLPPRRVSRDGHSR